MSARDREHRFMPTALFIGGSLLLWIVNFASVYVFAALACARGFADVHVVNVPIVPLVTTTASVAAGIASYVLLRKGSRALRDATGSEHSRFIGFVALMTSVMAIVALVLIALPPLFVAACGRPQ
jgi:hypothetical protein